MPLSWKEQIIRYLSRQRSNQKKLPVVLIGVGNLLMGDDAAGILVIQHLKASLPAGSFLIPIDGGTAPENITGLVRKHQPGLVVFVDAGDIGSEPGTIGLFPCDQSEGVSAFGHTLPLGVLGQFLKKELSCECLILIIQPGRIDFDLPVTREVQEAVDTITQTWLEFSRMA